MLVPPPELETNVSLWLWAVSQYKARVTFCSYSVMEMCARGLGAQTAALRVSVGGPGEPPGTVPEGRGGWKQKTLPGGPAPSSESSTPTHTCGAPRIPAAPPFF